MKLYLHALAMCQSMFCALPCPWHLWDEEARDRMLLFLPLIGLEIGALWAALAWLCRKLSLPPTVAALLLTAFPHFITGFLHLDGFMDVTDALRSWRDQARRREILKDSHVGSFAVIAVVFLLLGEFALFSGAPETADARVLIFLPAVSRSCSALAVTALPPMETSQYVRRKRSTGRLILLSVLLAVICIGAALLCGRSALALVACLAGYGYGLCRGYRSLGGMNGDISGYALTIGEFCGIAVYALL